MQKIVMEEDSESSEEQIHSPWRNLGPNSAELLPPSQTRGQPQPTPCQLADFGMAKDRFKSFLEQIGKLKNTPIREDIIAYCGGHKKSQKTIEPHIRPELLIRKLDARIQKMVKTKRIKRNWGEQDLKVLIWIISKYSDLHNYGGLERQLTHEDWAFIASLIPAATPQACMFKWLSIKKITLATHNWTEQESQMLGRIVGERVRGGTGQGEASDWKEISQQLYGLNEDHHKVYRNAKQCREHWTCYLSPHLKKGPWQLYEDIKLLKFIKDNKGLKRWSEIARHFEGRTENALKNRYTLLMDKQAKQVKNKGKTELQLISEYLEKNYVEQFTTQLTPRQDDSSDQHFHHANETESLEKSQKDAVKPKKEETQVDSNESLAITPVRVQMFNFSDLQTLDVHFFKNIQPGVIEPNGLFKKMPSSAAIKESAPGCFNRETAAGCFDRETAAGCYDKEAERPSRKPVGPFMLTPLTRPSCQT